MNRGISDAGLSYAAAPHVHGRGVGGGALGHDVRAVQEEGDAAEALRLALRAEVAARLVQALQARVLLCARRRAREQSGACGKLPPDYYMPFELIFSAAAQAGGVCKPAQNGAAQ